MKLLDVRIEEHSKLWVMLEEVSFSKRITPEQAKQVAQNIRAWRYSRGGLLAESVTRDAAFTFQRALWQYQTTTDGYRAIRAARRLLIQALRADIGLAEDMRGKNIYDIVAERQHIQAELTKVKDGLAAETSEQGRKATG